MDSSYDFCRTVDSLYLSAEHAKKIKTLKPYKDFKKSNESEESGNVIKALANEFTSTVHASDMDSYPIINSIRYQSVFGTYNCNWHLITDCYLHRISDQDSTYDYFVLETISEYDPYYDTNKIFINTADRFNTKLQAGYSTDAVRAGGPATQGGTTSVNVNIYPPEIGFTYTPGSKVSVSSSLSLANNNFDCTFSDATFLGTGFSDTTIFRTELSYKTYAPNSNTTFTAVDIYQRARNLSHSDQYPYAFNPQRYYYDY